MKWTALKKYSLATRTVVFPWDRGTSVIKSIALCQQRCCSAGLEETVYSVLKSLAFGMYGVCCDKWCKYYFKIDWLQEKQSVGKANVLTERKVINQLQKGGLVLNDKMLACKRFSGWLPQYPKLAATPPGLWKIPNPPLHENQAIFR